MSLSIVLAVGLDPWMLTAGAPVWRLAGYVVVSTESIFEAMALFDEGDFDLVLLSQSVPGEKSERFIALVRASGSSIPIAFIAGPAGDHIYCPGAIRNNDTRALVAGMDNLLLEEAKKWPAFSSSLPRYSVRDAA